MSQCIIWRHKVSGAICYQWKVATSLPVPFARQRRGITWRHKLNRHTTQCFEFNDLMIRVQYSTIQELLLTRWFSLHYRTWLGQNQRRVNSVIFDFYRFVIPHALDHLNLSHSLSLFLNLVFNSFQTFNVSDLSYIQYFYII